MVWNAKRATEGAVTCHYVQMFSQTSDDSFSIRLILSTAQGTHVSIRLDRHMWAVVVEDPNILEAEDRVRQDPGKAVELRCSCSRLLTSLPSSSSPCHPLAHWSAPR